MFCFLSYSSQQTNQIHPFVFFFGESTARQSAFRFYLTFSELLGLKSNEASVRSYICPSLHYLGNPPVDLVYIMHWPPLMYVLYRYLRGKLIMPGFRLPDFRHFSTLQSNESNAFDITMTLASSKHFIMSMEFDENLSQ